MRLPRPLARLRPSPAAVLAAVVVAAGLLCWWAPEAAHSLVTAFAAINARVGSVGP